MQVQIDDGELQSQSFHHLCSHFQEESQVAPKIF